MVTKGPKKRETVFNYITFKVDVVGLPNFCLL